MSKAIVISEICPLYASRDESSALADEALYGYVVEAGQVNGGFAAVTTSYRYSGFAPVRCLLFDGEAAERWESVRKFTPKTFFIDVLSQPRVQGAHLASVPRGGKLFIPDPRPDDEGWYKTVLPDGRVGFVRSASLEEEEESYRLRPEPVTRRLLTTNAMQFLGSQYRWGGKTARGVDCSGLLSLSYLLAGSVIYRDASLRDGYDMHEIPFEQLQEGDAIYYKTHVTMYLYGGIYLHSTGFCRSPGVVYNSFDPQSPLYRPDLDGTHIRCGSIFPVK